MNWQAKLAQMMFASFFLERKISEYYHDSKYVRSQLFVKDFLHDLYLFSGIVNVENTCSYSENREKYEKKNRKKSFKDAIRQCDEFISSPEVLCLTHFLSFTFRSYLFN